MSIVDAKRQKKFSLIILAYPLALILIAMAINGLVFGFDPLQIALPEQSVLRAVVVSTAMLVANHTWLMTSTELTRMRYRAYATPEEWAASGDDPADLSNEARSEIERRHNAHRNATENTVYFAMLAGVFMIVSPQQMLAQIWIIGFGIARLGYTFSYLSGRDGLRGVFMSLSLVALYGMAGYVLVGLFL